MSKHLRENITFRGLAYPKLTWSLRTLSLATNSSWLPGEQGCHASHQLSDASISKDRWIDEFIVFYRNVPTPGAESVTCFDCKPRALTATIQFHQRVRVGKTASFCGKRIASFAVTQVDTACRKVCCKSMVPTERGNHLDIS